MPSGKLPLLALQECNQQRKCSDDARRLNNLRASDLVVAESTALAFCLSCGEVHSSALCPYCSSDAQEQL